LVTGVGARLARLERARSATTTIDDVLHQRAAVRVHLDELDAHAGGRRIRRFFRRAHPDHATDAVDERRLVLELELELQQRADLHRLLRLDEDAAAREVLAVLLDELVERGALEANLEGKRRSLVLARVGHRGSEVAAALTTSRREGSDASDPWPLDEGARRRARKVPPAAR